MKPLTIHYSDGTKLVCENESEWLEASPWGVIAVTWPDPDVNVDFCYGRAFFFRAPWSGPECHSGDVGGLWDFLKETDLKGLPLADIEPGELISLGVKFGRTISTKEFNEILRPILDEYQAVVRPMNLPERNLV